MFDLSILDTRCKVALDALFTRVSSEHPEVLERAGPLSLSSIHGQHRTGVSFGEFLPFLCYNDGRDASLPPTRRGIKAHICPHRNVL